MESSEGTSEQYSELLYHYTTIDSFVSIVRGGDLWASHIRYLNDTSEQRLIWDHVRRRLKSRLEGADDAERTRILPFQSLANSPPELDIFVLSFSRDGGDRLSQWRTYGSNAGVSIGFASDELKRRCTAFTTAASENKPFPMGFAILNPVHYIESTRDERTDRIIDIFLNNPEVTQHESRFTKEEVFRRRISLQSFLKHKAFHEESEWRIAIFDLPENSVQFRTRRSMMVPFVPFDLGKGEPEWPLIRQVVVGPSPHQAETMTAIKMMLDDRTEVVRSSIPYRDW